jgi:1,4-dihydroxy-2-naphthoate octaprenyltransferase
MTSATATLAPARAMVAMARPSQVALILLVLATGALLGSWRGGDASAGAILLGLVLLVAAAVAAHWANEAADAETDARTTRTTRTRFSGGSGALLRSGVDATLPLRLSLLVAAGVVAAAIASVAAGVLPSPAGVLLLAGLAGSLGYSLPPVAAMRRGWGEPLNAVLGGLLLPLYGVAVVRGRIDPLDVAAFLPFMLVVFCSVLATAWPDREADAATGKRTLQVRWPARRLRRLQESAAVGWLLLTLLAVALDASPAAAAGLAVLPLLVLGVSWYTRRTSPWPMVAAMVLHAAITALALAAAVAA